MVKRRRNNHNNNNNNDVVDDDDNSNDVIEQKKQAKKQQKVDEKIIEKESVVIFEEDDKVSEDYCFCCKDGGLLIVCDHKGCVKAYHPSCVGQEEESEETDTPWICDWHSCLLCKKTPKYQCFCCPRAVCQSCFKDASFAKVRGSKGICNDCLNLALLAEEGLDVDSDGEKVDFKDRETYEGLFKEYWDIIKEKEGWTLDDLHYADVQIKKGDNNKVKSQKPESDSDESIKLEENIDSSEDDHDHVDIDEDYDSDDAVEPVIVTTHKKPKKTPKKQKGSSRIEYVGWASKALFEFLAAIGVDTSKKLSQSDVTSLINKYAQENKLFHPEKRKIVVCDERLRSLLKRKTISIYKISDGIEAHFLENLDQSEDEGYSSGYEENNATLPTKKQAWWRNVGTFQHKGSLLEKFQQKEGVLEEPEKIETPVEVAYSDFATIVPQNMKLVYLKKSLVESLMENCETFESKVTGSFVKVKSEPVDHRFPYQLLPITGIKKASFENKTVLLQVSTLHNDVPMRLLSNDDLSLEDCEELRQRIETGLIPKPTVVELEKKAKELHEDITKHAIARELSILKHRIDLANEKGRRAELYEFRRRRELLQTEEEKSRLLNELPKVIADVLEVKTEYKEADNNSDVGIKPSNNPCEIMEDANKITA